MVLQGRTILVLLDRTIKSTQRRALSALTGREDLREELQELVTVQAQRKCGSRGHDVGLARHPVQGGDLTEGVARSELDLVAVGDDDGPSLQEQEKAVPLVAALDNEGARRPLLADASVGQLPRTQCRSTCERSDTRDRPATSRAFVQGPVSGTEGAQGTGSGPAGRPRRQWPGSSLVTTQVGAWG